MEKGINLVKLKKMHSCKSKTNIKTLLDLFKPRKGAEFHKEQIGRGIQYLFY